MKKPLVLAFFTVIYLGAVAQPVDLDRFYFNATYRELPRRGLDTAWRTFSVGVETGPLCRLTVKDNYLEQLVNIGGWRKLNYNAHIQVRTRLEDVIVEKSQVIERVCNVMHITGEIMRRVAINTFEDLSARLTANYGFTQRTTSDFMWILDARKHPEYDAHRKAFSVVKQAMFQMNADEPVHKVRVKVIV